MTAETLLRRSLLVLLLLPATRAHTQSPTVPTPVFDVVSITPSKPGALGTGTETHEATFTATNADLTDLLLNAFDIQPDLITGLPPWATSSHWDLRAKVSDPNLAALRKLTADQRRSMLRQALADRFHLQVHLETRQLPVYNLVVTTHGPKFRPSSKASDAVGMSAGAGEVTLQGYPLAALAYTLSTTLHRTVIDQTNLPARYDLHLKWAPDDPAHIARPDSGLPADDTGPSLFSAIQDQLGLKLVPAKGPVPILVIDHVTPPTPN